MEADYVHISGDDVPDQYIRLRRAHGIRSGNVTTYEADEEEEYDVLVGDNGVVATNRSRHGSIPFGIRDAALTDRGARFYAPCRGCGGPRRNARCEYCGRVSREWA